jgi:hypothetical protein
VLAGWPKRSLRANGSRECAPEDRLREAIHSFFPMHDGLLRFARNDAEKFIPNLLPLLALFHPVLYYDRNLI